MQRTPRRPLAVLVAAVLATTGCGGAGYGEPIAATDDDPATVALAPAPVTTPGSDGTATTGATTGTGTSSPRAPASDDGGEGQATNDGGDGGAAGTDDGGGAQGGADALGAYARDANRFCSGFASATRSLAEQIGAAGSNAKGVGRAIVRYGDAITAAASGLRASPVPAGAGTYHQKTLDWVRGVTLAIQADRSGLQNGSQAAGATVVRKVQDLGKPPLGSAVPASVRSRAAACAT